MSTPGPNLVKWYPPVDDNPSPAQAALHLRLLYNGTNDHDQAITTLKNQVSTLDATVKTVTNTTTNTGRTITITDIAGFGNLAAVNNQSGSTAYTVQSGDNGSLIVLSDASPIAVTLNSVVLPPYFVYFANQGVGLVTMTASSGVINGASTIPGKTSAIVFFDGANWWTWAVLTPLSAAAVAHQWLKSYDATTGLFTQTQPDYSDLTGLPVLPSTFTAPTHQWMSTYSSTTGLFTSSQPAYTDLTGLPILPATAAPVASQWIASYDAITGVFSQSQPAFTDITGNLATAQLPTAGVSGVISLGPLTVGGTTGSITVTNGIITAFVDPT